MKHTIIVCAIAMAAMTGCSSPAENKTETVATTTDSATTVKTEETAPPPPPMDSAAMMKAMMEYSTPGDMQKMLASMDGKWETEVTTMMDPSKPAEKSKGSTVNKMIMGGRYQQSMHSGNMMGMPFEGMSITGYDNSKKVFVNTWVDNMGTGIMTMEGPYDAATKTIELKGKSTDPSTGKDCITRETLKIIDDKNQYMEMFVTQGGKEMKMMEIKYTKK